jgi:hypothetical protein
VHDKPRKSNAGAKPFDVVLKWFTGNGHSVKGHSLTEVNDEQ